MVRSENVGKVSVKEDKNIYQEVREEQGLSRKKATDIISKIENGRYAFLNEDRLVKVENETVKIQPEDVLALSLAYNKPELRNYYCCHQCPIGEKDAPEVVCMDNVHEILINMLVSFESINVKKTRLIEILADGKADNDEIGDLKKILQELEKISMTIEAIQLWCEKAKLINE